MTENQKIQNLIQNYISARLEYDEHDEAAKAAERVYRGARGDLTEAMLEAQQRGIKLESGLHIMIREMFSIACNQHNEEDVKSWLHDRYGDMEEFVVPKLDKKLVTDRIKNDIEGEVLDEFDVPEFFNLKTHPDISVSGWEKFSKATRGK